MKKLIEDKQQDKNRLRSRRDILFPFQVKPYLVQDMQAEQHDSQLSWLLQTLWINPEDLMKLSRRRLISTLAMLPSYSWQLSIAKKTIHLLTQKKVNWIILTPTWQLIEKVRYLAVIKYPNSNHRSITSVQSAYSFLSKILWEKIDNSWDFQLATYMTEAHLRLHPNSASMRKFNMLWITYNSPQNIMWESWRIMNCGYHNIDMVFYLFDEINNLKKWINIHKHKSFWKAVFQFFEMIIEWDFFELIKASRNWKSDLLEILQNHKHLVIWELKNEISRLRNEVSYLKWETDNTQIVFREIDWNFHDRYYLPNLLALKIYPDYDIMPILDSMWIDLNMLWTTTEQLKEIKIFYDRVVGSSKYQLLEENYISILNDSNNNQESLTCFLGKIDDFMAYIDYSFLTLNWVRASKNKLSKWLDHCVKNLLIKDDYTNEKITKIELRLDKSA